MCPLIGECGDSVNFKATETVVCSNPPSWEISVRRNEAKKKLFLCFKQLGKQIFLFSSKILVLIRPSVVSWPIPVQLAQRKSDALKNFHWPIRKFCIELFSESEACSALTKLWKTSHKLIAGFPADLSWPRILAFYNCVCRTDSVGRRYRRYRFWFRSARVEVG